MPPVKARPALDLIPPEKSAGAPTAIIYKATNRVTKWAYIGQTRKPLNVRRREHEANVAARRSGDIFGAGKRTSNYCRYFYNAMRKFGAEAFDWETLARVPAGMAHETEKEMIRAHGTMHPDGYNLEKGGATKFAEKPNKPVDFRADIRTEDIVRMRQAGMSHNDIARKLGCDRSLVRRRLNSASG